MFLAARKRNYILRNPGRFKLGRQDGKAGADFMFAVKSHSGYTRSGSVRLASKFLGNRQKRVITIPATKRPDKNVA